MTRWRSSVPYQFGDRMSARCSTGSIPPTAVLTPEPWWTRPTKDWVARRLCKYDELLNEERFPWVLTGDVVGSGPDHEPLVRMREPVLRVGGLALAEARELYEARFHVGQNSRSHGN